jgi:hypothetical protein
MVSAFEQRRDYVVDRLRQIPGIKLAEPQVRGFAGFGVFKVGRFYKTRITGQDVCVERGGGGASLMKGCACWVAEFI